MRRALAEQLPTRNAGGFKKKKKIPQTLRQDWLVTGNTYFVVSSCFRASHSGAALHNWLCKKIKNKTNPEKLDT